MRIKFVLQTFTATGTNLALQFNTRGLAGDDVCDPLSSKENIDFDREVGKVISDHNFVHFFCSYP